MYLDYFDKFKNMKPYFYIGKEEFDYIKTTFDKNDVCDSLVVVLMEYEPPYSPITKYDARRSFDDLKQSKFTDLLTEGEWFSRSSMINDDSLYKGKHLYFSRSNVGNKASNFFQQKNRFTVGSSHAKSPVEVWSSAQQMRSLVSSAYSLKMEFLNEQNLITMLQLRKYVCSQFKPIVAKSLYDYFKAENVLDFSMGWGDRLCGFYSSQYTKHYVGLDPRVENHQYYNEQKEHYDKWLTMFEDDKLTNFHISPAEDFDYTPYYNHFDLIFTSPPYFDAERYGEGDTQSWMRYKEIDTWNTLFLHKALKAMIPTVKQNGRIIVNIADIFSKKGNKWLHISKPLIEFMTNNGFEYEGVIGMEMSQRPNSAGAGRAAGENHSDEHKQFRDDNLDKTFCEPMWTFRKL